MQDARLLTRLFAIDAVTCLACAALLGFGGGVLSPLFGMPVELLHGAGLVLVPCAALFAWLASRQRPPVALAVVAILGNILWVVESAVTAAMLSGTITPIGTAFVAAQALAVLLLAALEAYALRRMLVARPA